MAANGPHTPGSLPPLKILLAFALQASLPLLPPSSVLLLDEALGSGWTIHWIMVFAARVHDIPRFFHADIFLPSSPNSW